MTGNTGTGTSTSFQDGPLWLGINDLQVDKRRNPLVQEHFVAQFSPFLTQSWDAVRTAVGTGCSEWGTSILRCGAWYLIFTEWQGYLPITAGIHETGPVWEGWIQDGKGLCRQ